ncbi:PDEase domain-containing protein, partial [Haematococcus lacustris]
MVQNILHVRKKHDTHVNHDALGKCARDSTRCLYCVHTKQASLVFDPSAVGPGGLVPVPEVPDSMTGKQQPLPLAVARMVIEFVQLRLKVTRRPGPWALDRSLHRNDLGVHVHAIECWRRGSHVSTAQAILGAVRANPFIVVTPLVVLMAILALGVWGILKGANSDAGAARTAAQSRLAGVALTLELTFSQASLPVRQLVDLIHHFPQYDTIMSMWLGWVPNWWNWAPGAQSVVMVMVPQGVISAVYPETPITTQQLGINIFDGFYRMETLASLTTKRFKVAGPYRQPGDNRLYTTVSAPVLFANVSNTETWGIPYTIDDCPVGLCYDTVTRTKLWGSVAITLDVDAIITDSNNRSILQQLTDSGLQYRLKAPSFGNDSLTATIYESTDGDMSSSMGAVRVGEGLASLLYRAAAGGAGAGGSPAQQCSDSSVAQQVHEHRALLRSLLPEEAIQKLQANFDWAADAMDENKPQAMLESGTPAEMILSIMGDIVVGRAPALPKSEVHEALMVQLMGRKAKAEPEEGEDTFNTEAFGKGEGGAAPAPATTRARGRGSRTSVPRITATAAPAAGQAAASAAAPISPTKPFKLGAAGPDPGSASPPKAAVPQSVSNH